ncbi:hypothetical protein PG1616B_1039 [Bifidobacterium pseudolongum subsp. globosum]|nr:hypothetical protein PG1616B_1039 [Bifidobacterium pseudolongum subsp. globosum]
MEFRIMIASRRHIKRILHRTFDHTNELIRLSLRKRKTRNPFLS